MDETDQPPKKEGWKPKSTAEEVPEEDAGEGWLTSYADLMTLVACFFIMMMSFANFDNPTFHKMAKEMGKHFKGANLQAVKNEFTELSTNMETMTHDNVMKITSSIDGVDLVFKSSYLFEPGSADLKPEMRETMELVIDAIKRKSTKFFIEIEGHADIVRTFKSKIFKDNWMLSASRAAAVIKVFEEKGYPSNMMRAVGYGDSRPKHPHFDMQGKIIEDNLAENRRIIVKISKLPEKLGFGLVYDNPIPDAPADTK